MQIVWHQTWHLFGTVGTPVGTFLGRASGREPQFILEKCAGRKVIFNVGNTDNLDSFREAGRRFIAGRLKLMSKEYEQEILQSNWQKIRIGLEVKLCHPVVSNESENLDASQPEMFILRHGRESSASYAAINAEHPHIDRASGLGKNR